MKSYKLNDWQAGNFIRDLQKHLKVKYGAPVEIVLNPDGSSVTIKKVLTPDEKTQNWVNENIHNIPRYVNFFVNGNTVVAYWQADGKRYHDFAVCSPDDKFDLNTGKVIAWTRAKNYQPPKFIYE